MSGDPPRVIHSHGLIDWIRRRIRLARASRRAAPPLEDAGRRRKRTPLASLPHLEMHEVTEDAVGDGDVPERPRGFFVDLRASRREGDRLREDPGRGGGESPRALAPRLGEGRVPEQRVRAREREELEEHRDAREQPQRGAVRVEALARGRAFPPFPPLTTSLSPTGWSYRYLPTKYKMLKKTRRSDL